jgi:hypothetical protein
MVQIHLTIKTNEEALTAWDRNSPVWTCVMGGLGPGYEQVIHLIAFELLRSMILLGPNFQNVAEHPAPLEDEKDLATMEEKIAAQDADHRIIREIIEEAEAKKAAHQKAWKEYADLIENTQNVRDVIEKLGPSGAQFSAAMNIASVFLINGYEKTIEMIPEGRAIMVTKEFPNLGSN